MNIIPYLVSQGVGVTHSEVRRLVRLGLVQVDGVVVDERYYLTAPKHTVTIKNRDPMIYGV